ncbi:Hypothetical protein (Fragment) [Durusdinium trenchii]|uniref:DUF4116 domain-containing protein n=1 Tax=Durusdinium trenchii TaxID=1381693 RepID=A0ABP0NWV4_9DINO
MASSWISSRRLFGSTKDQIERILLVLSPQDLKTSCCEFQFHDFHPAAHRPMVYFDPLDSESLSQWTQAINESLQDLEQAMMRDCRIAASRLVRDVVVRCCNSPERITNRRVTKLLLRNIFERVAQDMAAKEVSAVREDRQQAAKAVRRNSSLLRHMPQELRADREVVLAAVDADPMALAYADETLKADRAVVFRAISQDGMALEHSSDALKADRDMVLAAALRSPDALRFATPEVKADAGLVVF